MLHEWIVLGPYGLGQRLHDLIVGIDRVHMQLDDSLGLTVSSSHLIYHIEIGLCVFDHKTLASFSLYGLYIGTLGHHGLFYHFPIQFGHFRSPHILMSFMRINTADRHSGTFVTSINIYRHEISSLQLHLLHAHPIHLLHAHPMIGSMRCPSGSVITKGWL
ncbi:MAG: hypothetical protein A4E49_00185 [Methanosaeta sp. PtaU1.Bin112]|nr:MAG: hypothetical protein A4E49_00185 [Methanosaeta sp. PtaU1.Bin112]